MSTRSVTPWVASTTEERKRITQAFVERYEDVTINDPPFECVGLFHKQDIEQSVIDVDHRQDYRYKRTCMCHVHGNGI